jgi:myosin tail region-interacting protein MTI1
VFQNKNDISYEVEESQTKSRGGKVTISKEVYVLFPDYSQTIISARFDPKSPDDATLEQKHDSPPYQLRQDQLETYWQKYGSKIIEALSSKQNTTVGDGSPHALVTELLQPLRGALAPVGTRAFGAPVYANLANASVQQFDEIRPGDIVSFRNAKFQGKHSGVMHQKYHQEAGKPDHVGIVVEWDGTKKKIRAAEQGRDVKEGKKGKVAVESFRLGDLRSGEVRVWRVVGREWVGWSDE